MLFAVMAATTQPMTFAAASGTLQGAQSSQPASAPTQVPSAPPTTPTTAVPARPVPAPQSTVPATPSSSAPESTPRPGLNIVVLDPAHGGTDFGARGTGGIRESEIVLEFAAELKKRLESQGFQVLQTRQGNDNPSFDDRSAMANAQRGAIFVSLHIASTGLPGTVRVYVMSSMPATATGNGLIPWDRAQAPFLLLSRKLGDIVQGLLLQDFKGSPQFAQSASVRQLRTTAEPAIAVEISSVAVQDKSDLDRMIPGVADAISRGAAAFRPSYVVPSGFGERP